MIDPAANFRFGPYELRPRSRELFKFGTRIKLRPQPLQLLAMLLDRAGDVVTREQLQRELWPSDTFVDFDHGLNSSVKELRAVLNDSAAEPRYIQTLPKLGYRFIFAVERDREGGQQSAVNTRPVGPTAVVSPPPAAAVQSGRTWAWLPGAATVAVLVGLYLIAARIETFHRYVGGAASAAAKPRTSVAVLGFKNLSGRADEDWMSMAMGEMLAAELAAGRQVRVIPSENIARMKLDLGLPPADSYGQETLGKIRNDLGTDIVASGSYLAVGNGSTAKLRVDVQLQDARTGETMAVFSHEGPEDDLLQLIASGGDDLRRTLGIGALSRSDAVEARAAIPANSEAERLYAEGLVRLQNFDALGARALLEQALAADPNHALSHSALAQSLSVLGYDLKAQAEAKKAFDLSTNLSRESRLSIEGRYRALSNDRAAALEVYRTLHNLFPDNLDYSLSFARAQILATHPLDALQTVAEMRRLPDPEGKDPRIDLAESSASERLGDMKRSQSAAAAAIARAQAEGSGLMLANALGRESWAWNNLGEFDKAIADDTRARELWLTAGDTRNAAIALEGIAMDQQGKGDLVVARRSFEQALGEFRHIGANWNIASCSHNLAVLLVDQGELELAQDHFQEALRIQKSQNDKRGVSSDLDDLGNIAMSVGKLTAARQMKEEALQGFRDIGDKRGQAIVLVNLGEVLYQQGDLSAANEKYSQAAALQQEIAFKTGRGYSLFDVARILQAQDQLDQARATAEQSLVVRQEIKAEVESAESRVLLAEIALDEAKPGDAETFARQAASVFDQQKATGSASWAYATLARSLAAQGRIADAQTAADRAMALAHQGADRMFRLKAGLAAAEVEAREGKLGVAERNLVVLRDQARRDGYEAFEFEARLQLAEADRESGKRTAAQAQLDELRSDARSRGFLLIARQAAAPSPMIR